MMKPPGIGKAAVRMGKADHVIGTVTPQCRFCTMLPVEILSVPVVFQPVLKTIQRQRPLFLAGTRY